MMRIISGQARGTRLSTLRGDTTRPTLERAKEAMFSMIRAQIPGRRVLDLFAGSGQLGLEALSEGARDAVFCDRSREAAAVIEANIKKTHMEARSTLMCVDYAEALNRLRGGEPFGLVFLDPPYALHLVAPALEKLFAYGLLTPNAIIMAESDGSGIENGDKTLAERFSVVRTARYSAVYVTWLTPKEGEGQ